MRPRADAPIIALDIDGTSGDYHGHFTLFAEMWTGRPMPDPTQFTGGVPFNKHLGVSRSTYNKMKLAFRQGGWKRSMPPYHDIGRFTKMVRSRGVQVWICTTRPYLRLDNIDPDTRHWLRKRAGIQYDAIIYGPHKYRDLRDYVGAGRVVMVYDDLPEMIEQAHGVGMPTCLRLQPYNRYWVPTWPLGDGSANYYYAGSVEDMVRVFERGLREWKEQNDGK